MINNIGSIITTTSAAIAHIYAVKIYFAPTPSTIGPYSTIVFDIKENTANAKSVLSVLGACVKSGDEIEFVCEGEDEEEALKALVTAVENGLGE